MSPTHPNPSVALATVVVDELVRGGVRKFALSPGSRSAALAGAVMDHPGADPAVLIDERSACFFAMGVARASGRPAAVITTSGTAAANLFPGMVEADASDVPLVVLTADRPPELRGTGANQTIDQIKLFGRVVRWFWEAGPAEDRPESNSYWRASTARAVGEARGWGGRPGPVHLNLAFREPTTPTDDDGRFQAPPFRSATEGRQGGKPWVDSRRVSGPDLSLPLAEVEQARRGVIVVGEGAGGSDVYARLAERLGWPLLAEAMSGHRRPPSISTFHHLLQGLPSVLRPDLALCFGKTGLSPNLAKMLSDPSVPQVAVGAPGGWADPNRAVSHMVAGSPSSLGEAMLTRLEEREGGDWPDRWQEAERACRSVMDDILDEAPHPTEPRTARDLSAMALDGLVVGSSMPVRDVDWFAEKTPTRVLGNRGASGIDGLVSTALGAAWGSSGRLACLTGDLALLHDSNGFLVDRQLSCVMVVVNNNGGGIFNFLPQARYRHFEKLFATPHGRDLRALAAFHNLEYRRLERACDLAPTVENALGAGGLWLVEARTDRQENVRLHRRIAQEAARGVASVLG